MREMRENFNERNENQEESLQSATIHDAGGTRKIAVEIAALENYDYDYYLKIKEIPMFLKYLRFFLCIWLKEDGYAFFTRPKLQTSDANDRLKRVRHLWSITNSWRRVVVDANEPFDIVGRWHFRRTMRIESLRSRTSSRKEYSSFRDRQEITTLGTFASRSRQIAMRDKSVVN